MHLDFAFYIAMHLEGETWHICQRSLAMQIEITGFSVPPRGLFSSLRAVSLRAATTSRDRRSIARPPSPASRARLDEAAHNRTTQRAIGRIYDALLINAGQVRLLHQTLKPATDNNCAAQYIEQRPHELDQDIRLRSSNLGDALCNTARSILRYPRSHVGFTKFCCSRAATA